MSVTPPAPAEVPTGGVLLTVAGTDSEGRPSLLGLTNPAFAIDDPSSVFAFTPAADNMSATVVPNAGAEGQATITFTAGTTNADGTPGAEASATFVASVTPGNAVSVTLVASNL